MPYEISLNNIFGPPHSNLTPIPNQVEQNDPYFQFPCYPGIQMLIFLQNLDPQSSLSFTSSQVQCNRV